MEEYICITPENIDTQHICCAIADKKHQKGVAAKKAWLTERLREGHIFCKLNVKGKVFIEFAPLETAWVPVEGDNYMYIYCLWVSGQYKGKGHAKALLSYCIDEAKRNKKSGVCILSSKKKKPFLSDKAFMETFGFTSVDAVQDYELLSLSFDGSQPRFSKQVKDMFIPQKDLTVYYDVQCPYTLNCIEQIRDYCAVNAITIRTISVDTLEKAKSLPCIFNNWAVFYNGEFQTVHLLNEGFVKKMLAAHI